jgi:hypothetical protein
MIPVWQEARMIEANITHSETVSLNGETWTGPNAEGDCARALIGAGVEPGELLVFSRNGVDALRGTVEAFAGRAWGGADADPQFRRWRPHPKGDYPDLLLQWHALRLTGRPGGPARRHGRERGSAVSALS